MMDKLRAKAEYVTLSVGDMVIDLMTLNVGILLRRASRDNHGYVWEISWSSNNNEPYDVPNSRFMEEFGLKLSIVAGMYDLYRMNELILTSLE